MSLVDDIVALDRLTLTAATEQAGDRLDPADWRARVAASLARGRQLSVRGAQGHLLAYALLQPKPELGGAGDWFVTGFNTDPQRRGPALRALLRQMAELVRDQRIERLHSHVYKTNSASLAFHRRLGFAVVKENDKAVAFSAAVQDLKLPRA